MGVTSQAVIGHKKCGIKHHLIGELDPSREYNVNIFREKAEDIVESIVKRERIPIIVGGSGLYVKALIDGLFSSPEADMAFRSRNGEICKKIWKPEAS